MASLVKFLLPLEVIKMLKIQKIRGLFLILVCISLICLFFSTKSFANPVEIPAAKNQTSTEVKFASGALTLLYFPVKAVYAGLGGIVGGIAYVFQGGDKEAAQAVWTPTIKGTYVITPEHLEGRKPVQFFGRDDSEVAPDKFEFG